MFLVRSPSGDRPCVDRPGNIAVGWRVESLLSALLIEEALGIVRITPETRSLCGPLSPDWRSCLRNGFRSIQVLPTPAPPAKHPLTRHNAWRYVPTTKSSHWLR